MKSKLFLISLICLISQVGTASVRAQTTIRDAVKEKVAEELATIKQGVAKKAFVGTITAKSDLSLTITNLNNQSRTANLTTDATILSGGKEVTIKTIKDNDFVIAMGEVNSQNVMTIKRLLVITKPSTDKRQVVWAKVTKITSTTLTAEDLKANQWTIKLTSDTKKPKSLKEGDKVIIVGTTDKGDNALIGKIVRQI